MNIMKSNNKMEKIMMYVFIGLLLAIEFFVIQFYTVYISVTFGDERDIIFFIGQIIFALSWLFTIKYFVGDIVDYSPEEETENE